MGGSAIVVILAVLVILAILATLVTLIIVTYGRTPPARWGLCVVAVVNNCYKNCALLLHADVSALCLRGLPAR